MKISLLLIALLLSACGAVTDEDWKQAEESCAPFGGIEKVWVRNIAARCKDGREITQ